MCGGPTAPGRLAALRVLSGADQHCVSRQWAFGSNFGYAAAMTSDRPLTPPAIASAPRLSVVEDRGTPVTNYERRQAGGSLPPFSEGSTQMGGLVSSEIGRGKRPSRHAGGFIERAARFFAVGHRRPDERPSAQPEAGLCLYAIGDVHGRSDLLHRLLGDVAGHVRDLPADVRPRLVMLGDYVDRGADSRGVLDMLTALQTHGLSPWGLAPDAVEVVLLRGNHEDALTNFLEKPEDGAMWLANGGVATLESFGVPTGAMSRDQYREMAAALAEALGPRRRALLYGLGLMHRCGDYVFVHAGVEPGLPMDKQSPQSLMWIREPFLSSTADLGGVIVHGHTIVPRPDIRANRIGIDTGAYASGCLTCVVLQGEQRSFLST